MFKSTFVLLPLLLWLQPLYIQAQDVNVLLKEAQHLEAAFKDEEALNKYLEIVKMQPGNLNVLCRISELYTLAGKQQSTTKKQETYFRNAKTYAQKALLVNAASSEANVMMAIALGQMALIASGKEKITAVREIKTYAEKAIQLDANNFKAYHVLGKWHYEVSELGGTLKWLVKVTYGALPPASLDDALRNYEKCKQLSPGFLLNHFEIAKVYEAKDKDKKAIEVLEALLKMPNKTSNDESIKKDARKLISDLK